MDFSQKTQELIERQCRNVERKDFKLDKKKSEELILKTYDLFKLTRPKKIIWCKDIFDKKFVSSARSAWSAGSARSARSARSAGSAWSAGSADLQFTALDYDFNWYVFEFEYCQNPDSDKLPNENDKIYLEYCELLMQAKEVGLGYRVEWEDTLYLIPTPLVEIDEQNRFHSATKPAIRWKGGKEFYYLHGVNFEKKWWTKIVNDKFTPDQVFAIDNLEHRRIAYEYMDKSKMSKLKDFEVLDEATDEQGNKMKIIQFKVKNVDEPLKYLNVVCPTTGRIYFLGTNENKCFNAKYTSFGLDTLNHFNIEK